MCANEDVCPLCWKEFRNENIVSIGIKEAEELSKAIIERSDDIGVSVGKRVKKSCCLSYINKKGIEKYKGGIRELISCP